MAVCTCPRTALCHDCYGRALETLTSTAWRRGEHWAETVAERRPELLARPWPPLEGRCAAIAARRVADLSLDPRVLERLRSDLDARSRKRWEAIRAGQGG